MRRHRKRVLRLFGLAVLTALGLALAVLTVLILDKPLTKKLLFSYFSRRTGFSIAAEKLDYRLFPLQVEVEGLKTERKFRGLDLNLELGRIKAGGSLGRLFSRDRPLFDEIILQDVRLRMRVGQVSGQRIDWESVAGGLRRLGPLQIKNAGAEIDFPGGRAEITGADLDLRSSEQRGVFVWLLSAARTAFNSDQDRRSVSGSLRMAGEIELAGRPAFRGEVTFGSPRGTWNTVEVSPAEEIALKMRCEYLEEETRFSFSELDIALPSLARISGPLQIRLGKNPSLDWILRASLSPASILKLVKPHLPSRLAGLEAGGEIIVEGRVRHAGEDGPGTEILLNTTFNDAGLSYAGREFTWRSSLSGALTVKGVLPLIETAGRIALRKGNLTTRDLRVQNISAGIEVRLTPSLFLVPSIQARVENVRFRVGGEERVLSGVAAQGRGRLERSRERLSFDSLKLESREFSPFYIQAEFGLKPGSKRSLRVRSSDLDLGRTLSFFHPLLPAGVSSWNPQGSIAFEAAVEEVLPPEKKWEGSGTLSAAGLRLDNTEFTATAEGLAPEVRFSGGYSPSSEALLLDCSLSLAKGEILWREFYIDWAAHPLQGRWRGEYRVPARTLSVETLEFSLLPIGRAGVRGKAKAGNPFSFDLQVSVLIEDPAALLALIGGPDGAARFAAAWSGVLSSEARLQKAGESSSLAGHIQVQNGRISGDNGFPALAGIEARLPFCFLRAGAGADVEDPGQEDTGYLSVEEARGPGLTLGPLRLDILSFPNRWQIRPVSLDFWGGRASLGDTTFTFNPYGFRVEGRTSFVFRNGELARVLPGSAGSLLSGGFSADFPTVEISPERIALQGEARGRLFSGSWALRNLRLERPFSRRRTAVMDVSFSGLDLEQMTNALPFGRVTGIVRGEIEGLALSYGQPESFRFRLESVKKEGVRQTFSLRAVDSLTILSQGAGAVPSQSFFLRFIPAFPYEKIGIQCSLKNDIFLLGGLIEEDGVEYLVRRAKPFGINIINRDPSKMISFKDMVSRLKRIGTSKDR